MLEIIVGLAGVVAALVWGMWQRSRGRRDGAAQERAKGVQDAADRVERGRDALRDGRDSGSPADRLRGNDGRW